MTKYAFDKTCDAPSLARELRARGVTASVQTRPGKTEVWTDAPKADVSGVVQAHDASKADPSAAFGRTRALAKP